MRFVVALVVGMGCAGGVGPDPAAEQSKPRSPEPAAEDAPETPVQVVPQVPRSGRYQLLHVDAKNVVATFETRLMRWDASTGTARLVGQDLAIGGVNSLVRVPGRIGAWSGEGLTLYTLPEFEVEQTVRFAGRAPQHWAWSANGEVAIGWGRQATLFRGAPLAAARTFELPHVVGASLSADGARMALVSNRGAVEVWDADGEAPRWSRPGTSRGTSGRGLLLSPAGDRLVLALTGQRPALLDGSNGADISPLPAINYADYSFSPDGALLVSSSQEGGTVVWDARTGAQRHVLEPPEPRRGELRRRTLRWSPDGTSLVVALNYGANVFDPATGARRATVSGGLGAAYSADGTVLVAGGLVLDATTLEPRVDLHADGPIEPHNTVGFSPDGRFMFISNRVIDLSQEPPVQTSQSLWHPAGIAMAGTRGVNDQGALIDLTDRAVGYWPFRRRPSNLFAAAISPSGNRFAVRTMRSRDNAIFDAESQTRLWSLSPGAHGLAFLSEDRLLTGGSRLAQVLDLSNGNAVAEFPGDGHVIPVGVGVAAAGAILVIGPQAEAVTMDETGRGAMSASADGRYVLLGTSRTRSMQAPGPMMQPAVYDVTARRVVCELGPAADRIALGTRHVATSDRTSVQVWNIETCEKGARFEVRGFVSSMAFHPQTGRLAISTLDRVVEIRDPDSGTHHATLFGDVRAWTTVDRAGRFFPLATNGVAVQAGSRALRLSQIRGTHSDPTVLGRVLGLGGTARTVPSVEDLPEPPRVAVVSWTDKRFATLVIEDRGGGIGPVHRETPGGWAEVACEGTPTRCTVDLQEQPGARLCVGDRRGQVWSPVVRPYDARLPERAP